MESPFPDLPKLADTAGAAVGLIIATAITLSWVTARYVPAFDRYRTLTGERREGAGGRRREAVGQQIAFYQGRLRYLSWASEWLCWGMIGSVATIVLSVLSLLRPEWRLVSIAGTATLFIALMLFVVAVSLVMAENRLDRRAVASDAADLEGLPEDVHNGRPFAPSRAT